MNNEYTVDCCDKMKHELSEDIVVCILDNVPFTTKKQPPKLYLQSDGGHGGLCQVNFCPFCGKPVTVEEEWTEEERKQYLKHSDDDEGCP